MNKHIELVEKWLKDKESISLEELKANASEAAAEAVSADKAANFAAYAVAEYVRRFNEKELLN